MAEAKYGNALRACGFNHLGVYRFSFPFGPQIGAFDSWVAADHGILATVLPDASQLLLTSYFDPGPGAVVTSDVAGTDAQRPGYWRQHVLTLSVEVLVERHVQRIQAFLASGQGTWQPRCTPSLEGFFASSRGFSGGYERQELVGIGLRRAGRLLAAYLIAFLALGVLIFAMEFVRIR